MEKDEERTDAIRKALAFVLIIVKVKRRKGYTFMVNLVLENPIFLEQSPMS